MGSERDNKIPNFHNKWLFGMDARRCTDKPWQFFCTCTVVFPPPKMVEQTIVTSLNDVMRISHVIEGGNYKRGSAQPSLGSLAAAITVIWVFWHKH